MELAIITFLYICGMVSMWCLLVHSVEPQEFADKPGRLYLMTIFWVMPILFVIGSFIVLTTQFMFQRFRF